MRSKPEAVLELAADGHLIAMTPTGGETSGRNSRLLIQLGMALPGCDTSLRILVREERWQALTADQRRRSSPLCPDLVIELVRPSDEGPRGLTALRQKMASYQRNGTRLGWLLIPAQRAVEVWAPSTGGEQGRRLEPATRLEGAPEFPGLSIDQEAFWASCGHRRQPCGRGRNQGHHRHGTRQHQGTCRWCRG